VLYLYVYDLPNKHKRMGGKGVEDQCPIISVTGGYTNNLNCDRLSISLSQIAVYVKVIFPPACGTRKTLKSTN
jgi:hypothetical protein